MHVELLHCAHCLRIARRGVLTSGTQTLHTFSMYTMSICLVSLRYRPLKEFPDLVSVYLCVILCGVVLRCMDSHPIRAIGCMRSK